MPTNDAHTTEASSSDAGRFSVSWADLRRRFAAEGLLSSVQKGPDAPESLDLSDLTEDSRDVRPGGGFVAIRGTEADGHDYIGEALENGARLVICEDVPETAVEQAPEAILACVTDTRVALAEAAAALYGDPADQLRMIGVTGTNGKTTVAYLTQHLLQLLGVTVGLISTVEVRMGQGTSEAALTTPGPVELHRTLRTMVDEGCTACAMEVSSHALDQDRVHGLNYEVAVFTNLTVDHLDYHGTPLAYRLAKKKLFDELGPSATALYNADDEVSSEMISDTVATTVSFAVDEDADIRPRIVENSVDGLRLEFGEHTRTFRLAGRFNAYNLAAAYGVGLVLGYDAEPVVDALAEAPPVPGRFEQLRFENGPTVVVDYAHTPDALENILHAVRDAMSPDGTLWCVFGCGGDRDPTKRRTMGSIAEHLADRLIVTSDNPRSEEPESILNDIRRGINRPDDVRWIVDREAAIEAAAGATKPGDVVLIAGKGHETYQQIGTEKRPFDDREIARKHFG